MKKTNINLLILLILISIFAVLMYCNGGVPKLPEPENTYEPTEQDISDLKLLLSYMTGEFNSEDQVDNMGPDDDKKNIYINLKRVWSDQEEIHTLNGTGYWTYIEQSISDYDPDNPDNYSPYRQRVYHITITGEGEFKSYIYKFKSESSEGSAVGDVFEDNPLRLYKYNEDFTYAENCEITLNKVDTGGVITFEGGTGEHKNCVTQYYDPDQSEYVESYVQALDVVIAENYFESWDKIFTVAEDKQIGGSEVSPYKFDQITNYNTDDFTK